MLKSPLLVTHIAELREQLATIRATQRIALVPTMGNLHEGHLTLVEIAHAQADIVVVSIFVNPTQFGVGEDFDSYPRTLEADIAKLTEVEADIVFAPSVAEMYPKLPVQTQVLAGGISQILCGRSRPTHFDGVGLVVSKLFHIVQPHVAIFGCKDYQQLALIRQLVADLNMDIDIIGAPIVRAADGLALSSRNQYLSASERATAPFLHQTLGQLALRLQDLYEQNVLHEPQQLTALIAQSINTLTDAGFRVDYLEVRNADLSEINAEQLAAMPTRTQAGISAQPVSWVILVAAWLGKARLLDNEMVTFV